MRNALCIGINDYPGTGSDLAGCVNDANDWAEELTKREFDVEVMLDAQATGEAMRAGMRRLLQNAVSGDLVVITYSGHGTWVRDDNGDEPDGRDEALCPYDIATNGPLLDDELYDILMRPRPRGPGRDDLGLLPLRHGRPVRTVHPDRRRQGAVPAAGGVPRTG